MSRVSVLIPCHNAAPYIEAAIDSALAQDYPDIEVIVVDDGSNDGSGAIASGYLPTGVRVIQQRNRGAAAARNRALADASGDWCVFFDADDLLEPSFVTTQVRAALLAKADICFGCSRLTWPDGRYVDRQSFGPNTSVQIAIAEVLASGWYPPHAILWRREFIKSIGGWNETMRLNDDGELIARALMEAPAITSSKGSYAIYRQHNSPNRVSSQRTLEDLRKCFDAARSIHEKIALDPTFSVALPSLAHQTYEQATAAYEMGYVELGRDIEAFSRRIRKVHSSRSPLHRIAVNIIGLERKSRISRTLANIRSRLYSALR